MTSRGVAWSAALVLAVTTLSGCGSLDRASTDATGSSAVRATGAALYDFDATTVGGKDFRGSAIKGRPTVLWFWAPWCPTCKAQAPSVSKLAEKYGDRVAFVGVGGLDKDEQAINDFASRVSDNVTNLSDSRGVVWRHFGVTAQSTYLVLDSRGRVVGNGSLSADKLKDLVASLAS